MPVLALFKSTEHIYFTIAFVLGSLLYIWLTYFRHYNMVSYFRSRHYYGYEFDSFRKRFGFKNARQNAIIGHYRGEKVIIRWHQSDARGYFNVFEIRVGSMEHQFRFHWKPPSFNSMKNQLDVMISAKQQGLKEFELLPLTLDRRKNWIDVFVIVLILSVLLIGGIVFL